MSKILLNKAMFLFLALLFLFVFKHTNQMEAKNYTVTNYKEISEDYHYSTDIIKYKLKHYLPTISIEYKMDTLYEVVVYKSEGKLYYHFDELSKDSIFKQSLNIPDVRHVQLISFYIKDRNNLLKIDKKIDNLFFCIKETELFVYKFN